MKILVVDDDPQVLLSLTVGLRVQWPDCHVLPARDGASALRLFEEHEPDIVLLDIVLPDRSGYEVLEEIRQVSDKPVIILTARGAETDQVRGLELGADDYVVKPFRHLALVARIRAVLRRAHASTRPPPDFVDDNLAIDFRNGKVTVRGVPVTLTPVEFRVLAHLVRNRGRLVPHDVLTSRALGTREGAAGDYVKVFVSRLRAKLEAPMGGAKYIETERGRGYRFVPPRSAIARR